MATHLNGAFLLGDGGDLDTLKDNERTALDFPRSVKHSSVELDWALIELDDAKCYYNMVDTEGFRAESRLLELDTLKTVPPVGQLIVLTGRGIRKARGGGSSSSLRLPQLGRPLHVWSIDLEQSLGKF